MSSGLPRLFINLIPSKLLLCDAKAPDSGKYAFGKPLTMSLENHLAAPQISTVTESASRA